MNKYFQLGKGKGRKLLIVGESVAAKGWGGGQACYTPKGELLATGKRLNKLLAKFDLSVANCSFTELVLECLGQDRGLLAKKAVKYWPIFLKRVRKFKPKLIITLGVETLKIFNNLAKEKLKMGQISKIKLGNNYYWLLPIWHPSPRNPTGEAKNQKIFSRLKLSLI